jgi:hypothetical protein
MGERSRSRPELTFHPRVDRAHKGDGVTGDRRTQERNLSRVNRDRSTVGKGEVVGMTSGVANNQGHGCVAGDIDAAGLEPIIPRRDRDRDAGRRAAEICCRTVGWHTSSFSVDGSFAAAGTSAKRDAD